MIGGSAAGATLARPAQRAAAPEPRLRLTAALDAAPDFAAADIRPILVVESDVDAARMLVDQLARDGYQTESAMSAEHARMLARGRHPRLILIGGLSAPRGALELLEEIRQAGPRVTSWSPETPVIVVGGRSHELDMLRAFEAGADDFVAPSGRYLELRVRLRALLRRIEHSPAIAQHMRVGPLEIDVNRHAVRAHGSPVALRRLEFELLVHFASDPQRVFTKQELLRAVWGYRSCGATRTVDSHASRLRRKLEAHGGRWVINVWGVGYRLR